LSASSKIATLFLIALTGSDAPSTAGPLASALAKAFGVPVTVEITYVPAAKEEVAGTP
jgi:hypothetical protein